MIEAVLGIDPGNDNGYKGGGWVCIDRHRNATAGELPMLGKMLDVRALFNSLLIEYAPDLLIVLEEQGMRAGEGVKGGNTLMRNYGRLEGAALLSGCPVAVVKPKAWKDDILAYTTRDKPAAINYVSNNFPSINLRPGRIRKPHEGIADAGCIAAHGWTLVTTQRLPD